MAEHTFAGLTCSEVADLAPAFVLGALEAPESGAVRRHLAECPEAHPEMAELHSVVPALFEVVEPVVPPAALQDRILAAAAADTQRAIDTQRAVETERLADTKGAQRPQVVERTLKPDWTSFFRRPVWAALSAAAVLAVAVLGYWNADSAARIGELEAYRTAVVNVLEEAAKPGAQLALLSAPDGGGPSGLATVAADGAVAIVMRDLAPTSGSEVYEAWLIAGENAPIPIGELHVGGSRTATLITSHASLGPGVTVALTREPGPDSTTPTMPIIAVGQAKAQSS